MNALGCALLGVYEEGADDDGSAGAPGEDAAAVGTEGSTETAPMDDAGGEAYDAEDPDVSPADAFSTADVECRYVVITPGFCDQETCSVSCACNNHLLWRCVTAPEGYAYCSCS